jgi:metallo-beta-lactamase class B
MNAHATGAATAVCLALAFGTATTLGQPTMTVAGEVAAAKAAAQTYPSLLYQLCTPSDPKAPTPPTQGLVPGPNGGPPSRDQWYREPAKVFDNLYQLPMNDVTAWAVTTSDGIIVIDAVYDYSVEEVVVNGLRKLGLDPSRIKDVIVTHAHGDHFGGVPYLVEHYHPHVYFSATDWGVLAQDRQGKSIQRDMVATDGGKITLGDTTLTTYLTPGHTPGTISVLIPVKDKGKTHMLALWGGTRIGRQFSKEDLLSYSRSAARFRTVVEQNRVEGVISNHERFAEHFSKIAAQKANPNGPSPFLVGTDSVRNFLTVLEHCGNAVRLSL